MVFCSENGRVARGWKGLHEGLQVEVIRGPLQGVHGILLRKDKRHRLVLGVRLIQQAAAVEIDVNDVGPA